MTTSADDVALDKACRAVGLVSDGATLLHRHATTVYLLPLVKAVARVHSDPGTAARSRRAVDVTRWLNAQGFPAATPLDVDQPVVDDQWVVTFWKHHPQDDRLQPEPYRLGRLLRRLHALPTPPIALPPYVPLESVARHIEASSSLPPRDRAWLRRERENVLEAYHRLTFPLGVGLIHGDAYSGNLLWDDDRVVLGDWDEVSIGPRELDLVNTHQGARFGRTEQELRRFAQAYGHDVTTWPGYETLRSMRDLHTLGTYIRRADAGSAAAADQVRHRIDSLKRGDTTAQWAAS